MSTRNSPTTPPLSPARLLNGTVYVSGQVGMSGDGEIPESFADEVHAAIRNLAAALESVGSGLDQVVRVGVYLTDAGDFAEMNAIYREHFAEPYPARTTAVTGLAVPGPGSRSTQSPPPRADTAGRYPGDSRRQRPSACAGSPRASGVRWAGGRGGAAGRCLPGPAAPLG
ncbi:RidA family protein [Nonomuraea insulae]|uniref:RidA family protein n=1 Tax=Nonomuraea insulae TaxID=1616787 RepID=A0ABW1CGV2_9ACTN